MEHHDCSEKVYEGRSVYGRRCARAAVVSREQATREFVDEVVPRDTPEGWEGVAPETRRVAKDVVRTFWYCAQHDPVRIAQREAKRRAAERAAWDARQKREAGERATGEEIEARAKDLIARLGMGRQATTWTYRGEGRHRYPVGVSIAAVTLSFAEVEELLRALPCHTARPAPVEETV